MGDIRWPWQVWTSVLLVAVVVGLVGCGQSTPAGPIVQTGNGDCVIQGNSNSCSPQPPPITPVANPNPTTTCAGTPVVCTTAERGTRF